MSNKQKFIIVSGVQYALTERSGYLKVDMKGHAGWTSVWADTEDNIKRRIKQARQGGQ